MSSLGKRTAKPGFRKLAPLGLAADIFGKSGSVLKSFPYSAASVFDFYRERSVPSLVGMDGAFVASSVVKCPQLPDMEGEGAAPLHLLAYSWSSPFLFHIIKMIERTFPPTSDPCVSGGNVSGWTILCKVVPA